MAETSPVKIEHHVIFGKPSRKNPARRKIAKRRPASPRKKKNVLKNPTTAVRAPINIFLLGDPAAGKATQAAFLIKKFPLFDLDMGRELRQLQARDPKARAQMAKTYDRGHVTQTSIVREIFRKKIFSTPKTKGILFDGNPKQIGEAKLIYSWLKKQGRERAVLLYLSIPMTETIRRMSGRVEYFKGKFSKRSDDTQAALENRVKYYRKNIAGVIKFFRTKYPYAQISGLGTKAQVQKRITDFLKKNAV